MELRPFGRTGLRIGAIGLGTMMFGAKTDEAESNQILDLALERGVNFVDTADAYGGNETERIVGRALARDGRRRKIVLATKFFFQQGDDPNARGVSRRHVIEACDASLRRLQTDWIDLYQLHRPSADVPIDETLRALDDLIRAGKVRYVGGSMFPAWRIVESLWVAKELGTNRLVSEQPAFNLLDRTAEREVIPAAQTYGLAVIPWGPLCGGLLSGKYDRSQNDAAGRGQGGKDNFGRQATPLAFDVIDQLRAMAKEKGCTVSQLALAWCAAQPGVTAPIIGPRTLEQARDNLGAADVRVDADDFARLDALVPPRSAAVRYYDAAAGVDFRPSRHRSLV